MLTGERRTPIKLLSFDLDDTLWPCTPTIYRAEQRLYEWMRKHVPGIAEWHTVDSLREQRLAFIRRHPAMSHDLSRTRLESMRELSASHGHDDDWVEPAFEVFLEARQHVELYAEVAPVLDELAGRYRMAAVSNGNADIERTGVSRWMELGVNAEQAGIAKPHPEIFRHLLERTGNRAEEVIHIGDHPVHDILGASQAGIATIWVNRDDRPWEHGDFQADREICDLGGLTAAIGEIESVNRG